MLKIRGRSIGTAAGARVCAAVAGALLVLAGTIQPASAHSVGAYPTQVLFPNSLRKGVYQQTIGIIDDSPTPEMFRLSITGDIAGWATFRLASDPSTTVSSAQAGGGPPTQVILQVAVPATAGDGSYQGLVHITPSQVDPSKGDQSGQGVGISSEIPVGVKVTGTQVVAGTLLDAYTFPAMEVGYPLRLFTVLTNSGNVEVHPTISVSLTRAGVPEYSHVFTADPIDPGLGSKTLESDWTDTSAAPVGTYVAHVDVKYFGTEIGSRDVTFKMVPYGTLRRAGSLDSLSLQNRPRAGAAALVAAGVRNTGEIETRPVFQGALYLNGQLLSGVTSQPILTLPGQRNNIQMVINVPRNGEYTLRGQANFDGTESRARSLSFRIGPPPPFPILRWGLVAAVVVLAAALVWWLRSRRRPRRTGGEPLSPSPRPTGVQPRAGTGSGGSRYRGRWFGGRAPGRTGPDSGSAA